MEVVVDIHYLRKMGVACRLSGNVIRDELPESGQRQILAFCHSISLPESQIVTRQFATEKWRSLCLLVYYGKHWVQRA